MNNKIIGSDKKFPFIDDLVDTLYNETLNDLINKRIETPVDKKVFLMFIMMYFVVYLQIPEADDKEETIKLMLNEMIGNLEKRKLFIDFFEEKFNQFDFSNDNSIQYDVKKIMDKEDKNNL